jgi:hypothetical protein
MQIYRSKVPFYVNISNPDRVQTFLTGFNRPVYCIFFYLKKKKEQEKLDFQSRGYILQNFGKKSQIKTGFLSCNVQRVQRAYSWTYSSDIAMVAATKKKINS